MFEAFFTDPCMRYRTEVINGIDFYGLGFSMVRGECVAEGTLRWMQEGEAAAVLITNTSLPDMSGFELARHVRRQFPCLRVIFLTDTPNLAEAQQAVRCGAYDYLPKSDGIDALRSAMIRVSEELHTESREEAYLRGQCLIPAANFCAQFLHQRAHQQSLHAQRSIAQQRLDFGIHLPVILVDARFQCQKQLQKSRNALIPVLLAAQICFFPTFRVQFL